MYICQGGRITLGVGCSIQMDKNGNILSEAKLQANILEKVLGKEKYDSLMIEM